MSSERKTKRSRMGMRVAMMVGGLSICGLYMYATGSYMGDTVSGEDQWNPESYASASRRHLTGVGPGSGNDCRNTTQPTICIGEVSSISCKKLGDDQMWQIGAVVLMLLYLFVGIAIVCDELFVPALEILAEELELSNDVAGATLMAAGGSAPELATSFVGTFKRSDVGFGTIVGSAVFNVLFVIGMCVLFTPPHFSPLCLTWWPLFRDCTYYVLVLCTLVFFMYDSVIEIWEAVVQLSLYFGYVYMMSQSDALEGWFTRTFVDRKVSPTELSDMSEEAGEQKEEKHKSDEPTANFTRPSTFRVGILQLLTAKTSITETAGIAFVSKIKGDVNEVFAKIDTNGNGSIDKEELRACLAELGTPEEELTPDKIQQCMDSMDPGKIGHCTKGAFTIWYTGNEQRLKNQTREIFKKYDTDKSPPGTIRRIDVVEFMKELGHGHLSASAEEEIQLAAQAIVSTCKDTDCLTYEDFDIWYETSLFWEAEKATAEQAADAQTTMWQGVQSGAADLLDGQVPFSTKFNYLLTLPLSLLFCLIPDCRAPGRESWAGGTLLGSVIMIALIAIVMVELAEVFGKSLGIPDVVMGLTILAAGTSVPDLLSSVIVAQQGQGDMAVSSSIGSNIFDVAFGLPLPWLTFNIVALVNDCNCFVMVGSDGLFGNLVVLIGMVALVVVVIHFSGWQMTSGLGYLFFFFYFAYVGFSLWMTPKEEYKVDNCSPFNAW